MSIQSVVEDAVDQQAGAVFEVANDNALLVPVDAPRKSLNYRSMARLATIPATGYASEDAVGKVVIYLPYLPESIEFPRENNYDQAGSNLVMPDGLWIYQSTNPLELNLEFTLHYTDDLCIEGSKTLLDIASRFHTLLLPASNDPSRSRAKSPPATGTGASATSQELQLQSAAVQSEDALKNTTNVQNASYKYPPACSLRLIQAGARGLGVHCVGFIKAATPIFHGPYMQTVDGGNAYNLPTAATYRFTFVHNPSYTGTMKIGKFVNAFGPDVFEYFYNTAHLGPLTQNTYADVEDLDQSSANATSNP
jgi:hypothetical protein